MKNFKSLLTIGVLFSIHTFAASNSQIIECGIHAEGPLLSRDGKIISHVEVDGNKLTASSLLDVKGTYGIEEHLSLDNNQIQDFYQYSMYGNPNHKWIHMKVDRSAGSPSIKVGVIRADDTDDFDKWIRKASGPDSNMYKSQKPFFIANFENGLYDVVRKAPMQAPWIFKFDTAQPTDRTGDMGPKPFSDELVNPFFYVFYKIRTMSPEEAKNAVLQPKLFVVGKKKQIYPTTFKSQPTDKPGVYAWKTAIVLQEREQPMKMLIDHNTGKILSFRVDVTFTYKVPVLGEQEGSATLESTGPCTLR